MDVLFQFLFGFIVAFTGSITPSMLNMTALKTSLQNDVKEAHRYILGVSFVVLFQAFVAVFLSKYILENPSILDTIEKFGTVIFIFLAVYFYKESKKEKRPDDQKKSQQKNYFLTGLTLSSLNMFAIPFFCGVVAFLDLLNQFSFDAFPVFVFILGAGIGTFCILFLYVKYAKKIQEKTGKLTKDINLVLSILTAIVALFSMVKFVYQAINL
jgi:threonine/homoserine/homoserine lactone efflux protein